MADFNTYKDEAERLLKQDLAPRAAAWDEAGTIDDSDLKLALDKKLHMLNVEEEYGGLSFNYYQGGIIKEFMGWTDASLSARLCASMLSYIPVALAGTEDQKRRIASIYNDGGLGCFCLTEAQGGSDATQCKVSAVKKGDEYVINGTKSLIINTDKAQVFMVVAITDPEAGARGISTFMVEADRKGVKRGKKERTLGLCAAGTSELHFEDVVVPASNLIGAEGKGFGLAMQALDRSRPGVGSVAVGLSQRAMEEAIAYAKERVAFGKPIAKHQAVAFMLADMEIRTQAARQLANYANKLLDDGQASSSASSAAKAFAGDSAMQTASDAVQILAGYGYCKDYPVERLMRDAKIFQIFEGTNQIQRVIISGDLLR